jgi:hypothetical protein
MIDEATNSGEFSPEDETSLPESAEQSETQETVEPTEEEAEGKPRKATAKDRIDELTRLRREAERDAEYWRAKALAQPESRPEPAKQIETEKSPDPEQYEAGEFDARYVRDMARWEAKQEVASAIASVKAEQSKAQSDHEWQSRIAKAAETLPDFEEKVIHGANRGAWACSQEMGEALRASDKGPELAYHLASNPTEAARIARLSPALQIMALGEIKADLSRPKPKTVTEAPTPIPHSRGSGGKFQVSADTDDFAAFDKTYGNGS